jgi:hypothetical protein
VGKTLHGVLLSVVIVKKSMAEVHMIGLIGCHIYGGKNKENAGAMSELMKMKLALPN